MWSMKITVTAKVDEQIVAELERLADGLKVTRSQLVAWAVERGVEDLRVQLAKLKEAGLDGLPGIPEVKAS